jgi:hypothetical protein
MDAVMTCHDGALFDGGGDTMKYSFLSREAHRQCKQTPCAYWAALSRAPAEASSRAQEREVERQLALRVIDVGFKVLAREIHPDAGGSHDAMARLNRVRHAMRRVVSGDAR